MLLAGLINWNDAERTLSRLDQLLSERVELEVVVVDNGSGSNDLARLRERLGPERVLANGANRGYAGGMNVLLRHALARADVSAVLLLTPDAVLRTGTLGRMLEVLQSHPEAGAVGPLVVYREEPRPLIGAGGTVQPRRVQAPLLRAPRSAEPYAVDWIDGCCMLLRREAIEAVGGFDERFFAYFEETDLCERLRRAGWSIWLAPEATVRHPKGDALPPTYYFYYMARNRYLFWQKNFGISPARVALQLAGESARLCASMLRPHPALTGGMRARWAVRQLVGSWRGTVDYLRGRFGAMPGQA